MPTYTDQTGHEVFLPKTPERIVSLVPSQTEYLFHLGLKHQVKGVTWFCIHPKEEVSGIEKVGGTKKLKLEKIRNLQPDLILANKEENFKEDIEALRTEFPVWTSDIVTVDDAFNMMLSVGDLTDRQIQAAESVNQIKESFKSLKSLEGTVLYLIWKEPWMGVGKNTYINSLLEKIGLTNVLGQNERYPEISKKRIGELNPDFIFYSSEPFPFKKEHMQELIKTLPDSKHVLVDGEMFSWYGNRMLRFTSYVQNTILEAINK